MMQTASCNDQQRSSYCNHQLLACLCLLLHDVASYVMNVKHGVSLAVAMTTSASAGVMASLPLIPVFGPLADVRFVSLRYQIIQAASAILHGDNIDWYTNM